MTVIKNIPVTTVSATDYEPFIWEGEQIGEVHWLRQTASGDGMLLAGLAKSEPRTVALTYPFDETLMLLEGEVNLNIDGLSVDLHPGGIISLSKGQHVVWNVITPFKKFFVDTSDTPL